MPKSDWFPPRYYLEIAESGQRISIDQIRRPDPPMAQCLSELGLNTLPGLRDLPPMELHIFPWDQDDQHIEKWVWVKARLRLNLPGRIVANGEVRRVGPATFQFRETFDEDKTMICNACANQQHNACQTWVRPDGTVRQHESKTWCDCQHKPHIEKENNQ